MSDPIIPPITPNDGWRVRILDLSGGAEDGMVEDIKGFVNLDHANLFARRYVRDSIERCRATGMPVADVLTAWHTYGEDAEVLEAGTAAWRSATDAQAFAEVKAPLPERDWRAIDPRQVSFSDETPGEDETAA